LVAHAEGTSGHFGTGTRNSKDTVVAFFHELCFVQFSGGSNPEFRREGLTETVEELSCGSETSNVGHAGSNKDLINVLVCNFTKKTDGSGSLGSANKGRHWLIAPIVRGGMSGRHSYWFRRGNLVSDDGWFVEEPFGVERTAVAGLIHQLRNLSIHHKATIVLIDSTVITLFITLL
jgi:hypothetical protein